MASSQRGPPASRASDLRCQLLAAGRWCLSGTRGTRRSASRQSAGWTRLASSWARHPSCLVSRGGHFQGCCGFLPHHSALDWRPGMHAVQRTLHHCPTRPPLCACRPAGKKFASGASIVKNAEGKEHIDCQVGAKGGRWQLGRAGGQHTRERRQATGMGALNR